MQQIWWVLGNTKQIALVTKRTHFKDHKKNIQCTKQLLTRPGEPGQLRFHGKNWSRCSLVEFVDQSCPGDSTRVQKNYSKFPDVAWRSSWKASFQRAHKSFHLSPSLGQIGTGKMWPLIWCPWQVTHRSNQMYSLKSHFRKREGTLLPFFPLQCPSHWVRKVQVCHQKSKASTY